jgi:hypothetical protein
MTIKNMQIKRGQAADTPVKKCVLTKERGER